MPEGIQVQLKGPLFTNAGIITDKEAGKFIQRLVELGEQRLDQVLKPRPGGVYKSNFRNQKTKISQGSKGNYRRNIAGVTKGLKGVIEDGHPKRVIYGPWLEGVSSRNQTTRFKGYASFRRTEEWLQSRVKPEAKAFVHRYAKKLNGT